MLFSLVHWLKSCSTQIPTILPAITMKKNKIEISKRQLGILPETFYKINFIYRCDWSIRHDQFWWVITVCMRIHGLLYWIFTTFTVRYIRYWLQLLLYFSSIQFFIFHSADLIWHSINISIYYLDLHIYDSNGLAIVETFLLWH